MNAYETAQSLGLTGTDAEVVAALKATGLTASPVDRATLVHVLNMRGMLTKVVGNNSDEKWIGTVLNMQDTILAAGTDLQKAGIRLWLSHITNPTNLKWDTTQVDFAASFWQMAQTFAGQSINDKPMPSVDDFQTLADLGGGWRFATLTVEQYAAQRVVAEDLVVKIPIISACRASLSALASKVTNASAWLDALDLSTKTASELQAYCDSLLASQTGNP